MNEVGVVGDIHGHADPLERLLGGLEGVVRQLVFLGDYVNRGPDSARVIDLLVALGERVPCVFLEGNHDAAFRRALRGEFDAFLAMGGAATIRSYVSPPYVDVERELTEAIPLSHRSFLHNLVPSYETAEIVVGHVLPGPDQAGRFRIGGHTPQLASVPTVGEGFASVDTGCGTLERGTLSCFLWPSRSWRSVAV